MKKRIISIFLLLLIIMSFSVYTFAGDTLFTWSNVSRKVNQDAIENTTIETNADIIDNNNPLELTAGSACLMEQSTGQVLYNHNMHEPLRPASVTKIMSLLLIMEALDSGKISLTDKVPCTEDAAAMGGSQIWLDVRETLTVDEMIKAICVVSANDCVVAMANYLEGSQSAFVNKMNEKAKELGMNDTTFKNCHGIDEDGHLTSSYDIALMSRELLINHPEITKYTTIYMDSLRDGKSSLVNTNKLIRNYQGCTGLKTGSTSIALYNLSATATRGDLSLIAVIMRAETSKIRFAEASKLLDYGFNSYELKKLGSKNEVIKEIKVNKGLEENIEVILENDYGILVKKGDNDEIEKTISIDDSLNAPILQGQKVGEVVYSKNGEIIETVNVIAKNKVDKLSFGAVSKKIYYNWFSILRN